MKSYTCWASDTCFVCRSISGPRIHARQDGYKPSSACDSVPVEIKAESRTEAVKQARKHFARFL